MESNVTDDFNYMGLAWGNPAEIDKYSDDGPAPMSTGGPVPQAETVPLLPIQPSLPAAIVVPTNASVSWDEPMEQIIIEVPARLLTELRDRITKSIVQSLLKEQ